nr:crosslink repair DNA glycosylase YcaQ family protein [Pseudonocardia oceani]
MKLTWRQVRRWRTRRQLLLSPGPTPVEVARALGGVHAQVASCAALISGVRCGTAPDADLAARRLVRTWAARGTLHLLPADELDLWVGALTARDARRRFPPSWEREHGVTAAQLHAVTDAIGEVLGDVPLTRAGLVDAVVAHLGDPAIAGPLSTGWGALLKPAAARGLLCSGPAADGAVTFVSPPPGSGARSTLPRPPRPSGRCCCASWPRTARPPRPTSHAGGASSPRRRGGRSGRPRTRWPRSSSTGSRGSSSAPRTSASWRRCPTAAPTPPTPHCCCPDSTRG